MYIECPEQYISFPPFPEKGNFSLTWEEAIYKYPQMISCKSYIYITRANIKWKLNLFMQENKKERGGGIYIIYIDFISSEQ